MALMTCTGTVGIRERLAIPPGSVASIKVVDAAGEVLAAAAYEAAGTPVEFALTLDDSLADGDLFVWAMLNTEVGMWGTFELAPYVPATDVTLTRIEG